MDSIPGLVLESADDFPEHKTQIGRCRNVHVSALEWEHRHGRGTEHPWKYLHKSLAYNTLAQRREDGRPFEC